MQPSTNPSRTIEAPRQLTTVVHHPKGHVLFRGGQRADAMYLRR